MTTELQCLAHEPRAPLARELCRSVHKKWVQGAREGEAGCVPRKRESDSKGKRDPGTTCMEPRVTGASAVVWQMVQCRIE